MSRPGSEVRTFQTRLRLTAASVIRWRHLVAYNGVSYPVIKRTPSVTSRIYFKQYFVYLTPHVSDQRDESETLYKNMES